jgi:hypothetical protein
LATQKDSRRYGWSLPSELAGSGRIATGDVRAAAREIGADEIELWDCAARISLPLGDAATTKLVFVVFRAFVGFVHDIAQSASAMADEPRPGLAPDN